jgi:hypothetical protein
VQRAAAWLVVAAACGRIDFDALPGTGVFQQIALPPGGNVDGVHVASDGTIYIAVTGYHLMKSSDHGASWRECGRPTLTDIDAFAIDPATGALYTAGDTDVQTSTDGCASWHSAGLGREADQAIAVYGADLFAGSTTGLYRRSSVGTWSPVSTPADGSNVHAIAVDVTTTSILLASDVGVVRSIDGGATWAIAQTGIVGAGTVWFVTYGPAGSGLAFTVAGSPPMLYRSSDNTATWTQVAGNASSLAVDPRDATFAVAETFGYGLNDSTDGGMTFGTFDLRPAAMDGAPVHAFAFDPVTSEVYLATGRGLFAALDHSLALTEVDNARSAWVVRSIAIGDNGEIYLATESGVLRSMDGGASWNDEAQGLRNSSELYSVAPAAGQPGSILTAGVIALSQSSDGGLTYMSLHDADAFDGYAVRALRFAGTQLLAGTNTGMLTAVSPWTTQNATMIGNAQPILDVLPLDMTGGSLLAATSDGLYYTSDSAVTFADVGTGLPGRFVEALAQLADGTILVGTSKGVSRSSSPTGPWSPSGLDGVSITALLTVSDRVFATSSAGVFVSSDGATWTSLPGLEQRDPISLAVDGAGRLLVGTEGYGLYATPLP